MSIKYSKCVRFYFKLAGATKRKHSDANELQDDIGTAKTNPHENVSTLVSKCVKMGTKLEGNKYVFFF